MTWNCRPQSRLVAPSGHGRSLLFVPTCPARCHALSLHLLRLPHLSSPLLLPPPLARWAFVLAHPVAADQLPALWFDPRSPNLSPQSGKTNLVKTKVSPSPSRLRTLPSFPLPGPHLERPRHIRLCVTHSSGRVQSVRALRTFWGAGKPSHLYHLVAHQCRGLRRRPHD